jgi:hypothetical protein
MRALRRVVNGELAVVRRLPRDVTVAPRATAAIRVRSTMSRVAVGRIRWGALPRVGCTCRDRRGAFLARQEDIGICQFAEPTSAGRILAGERCAERPTIWAADGQLGSSGPKSASSCRQSRVDGATPDEVQAPHRVRDGMDASSRRDRD